MRRLLRITLSTVIVAGALPVLCAQDLAPRAYIVTPVHWNAHDHAELVQAIKRGRVQSAS